MNDGTNHVLLDLVRIRARGGRRLAGRRRRQHPPERGKTPLVPALMREVDQRTHIARWAREHHLTGLSPDSLTASPTQLPVPLTYLPLHPGRR